MKVNQHSKYLRFIFCFLLILWGIVGIFDFVNYYFDWNKPLVINKMDASFNSLNLRGPELLPRVPEEIRILALGDSVTYGLSMGFKEDWPSRMEIYLRKNGVPATSLNAGKISYRNKEMFESFQALLDRGEKPNLIVYYGSGNFLSLYDVNESIYGNIDLTLNQIFNNFPISLEVQEKFNMKNAVKDEKALSLPQLIKSQAYYSSLFALNVKKISEMKNMTKQFDEKKTTSYSPTNKESEVIYLSKILKLAKKINAPVLIVKPFYLFKYSKFTEEFWKTFYRFHLTFSDLPNVRQRLSELDLFFGKFKDFAYVVDPTEAIVSHFHPNSDLEDAKRIMLGDFVHFRFEGNEIVGNYIGAQLLSLGLVKKVSLGEWSHPKEIARDEMNEANI